jgi:hypothetical protein
MTDAPDLPADPGDTDAILLPDGVLRVTDTDTSRRRVYARYDALDEGDDAAFEICCRLVSAGSSYGVGFGFMDTRKSIEVALFENQVAMYLLEGATGAAVDTTDAMHTYRLVKTGSSSIEVTVDGAALLTVPYEDLADRTLEFPGHQRQVLATSGAEASQWDIAYAAYSISGTDH